VFQRNVEEILQRLSATDLVLDVGGWACPFNRAQWILDAEPFATRGYYRTFGGAASQGGEKEWFTSRTWVQRDICGREPWPFADKQFDFVICSHTLEDIRDPLWVCSELIRVGKRGYLEVPSRLAETCRGWEAPNLAGLSHHRWLIDFDSAAKSVRFLMKYHMIHSHWRFSFPPSFLHSLPEEKRVQWLFWEEKFTFSETTLHGIDVMAAELEGYVARHHPYPSWKFKADHATRLVTDSFARAWRKVAG
jgi:Methyltransferase domain